MQGSLTEQISSPWRDKKISTSQDFSAFLALCIRSRRRCYPRGLSSRQMHCTGLFSCQSKKAPGKALRGFKFPTSQQQIPLSKQRHWSLPAEGFSGLQIVQSLRWNNYTEPPSDLIYSHLLLLCSPGFTEEVFGEAGQDQAQEAYRKCY